MPDIVYSNNTASSLQLRVVEIGNNNTSSSGGYLVPNAGTAPLNDIPLLVYLQKVVVGITLLPNNLVRPATNPIPANIPPVGTNWVSFYIQSRYSDTFAYEEEQNETYSVDRTEDLEILMTFYGQNAEHYATIFKQGLDLTQNRDELIEAQIDHVECQSMVYVPYQVNTQWNRRIDMVWRIRRVVGIDYSIVSLKSACFEIRTDEPFHDINFCVPSINYVSMVYSLQQNLGYSISAVIDDNTDNINYSKLTVSGYGILLDINFALNYSQISLNKAYETTLSVKRQININYLKNSSTSSFVLAYITNRFPFNISYSANNASGYQLYSTISPALPITYDSINNTTNYRFTVKPFNLNIISYLGNEVSGYNLIQANGYYITPQYRPRLSAAGYLLKSTINNSLQTRYTQQSAVGYIFSTSVLSNNTVNYEQQRVINYSIAAYRSLALNYEILPQINNYVLGSFIRGNNSVNYQVLSVNPYYFSAGTIGTSSFIYTTNSSRGYQLTQSINNPTFTWDSNLLGNKWDMGKYLQ